jgi:hypothetical protein
MGIGNANNLMGYEKSKRAAIWYFWFLLFRAGGAKKDERSSNLWSDISTGTFAGVQSSSFAAAIVLEVHFSAGSDGMYWSRSGFSLSDVRWMDGLLTGRAQQAEY